MPNGMMVGGFSSVNGSIVCTHFCLCMVLGLNTCFGACSWFKHTEVRFGEPEPAKLEGRGWQEAYLSHFLVD
jgi:hypothetical protein